MKRIIFAACLFLAPPGISELDVVVVVNYDGKSFAKVGNNFEQVFQDVYVESITRGISNPDLIMHTVEPNTYDNLLKGYLLADTLMRAL